jgi:cytosine/adenosine deaminase-related metal-dependent hydrolase
LSEETLLIRNADVLATMVDGAGRISGGGLFARGNVIEAVGPSDTLPQRADRVIDAHGMVVLPGLVNTHHHLYQTLTRALPAVQNAGLFDWLRVLYPVWGRLTPEAVYTSALVGLAELVLSGCTTACDHLYLYPDGCRLDDEIAAATACGIRFHACRGAMSVGASEGGLPPDALVEDERQILRDSRRVIETYHDPRAYAMLRVALAPCSPFSVSPGLMRTTAELARDAGVHLHTHLAETLDEERYCLRRFGKRPVAYAAELGWLGEDVWHAHCVHLQTEEVALFAETGTGVCHCPSSNMRLGSGIAPVRQYLDAGVRTGIGVDGSASNDASHLLAEARMATLLQRVLGGPEALTADEALWMATAGGARVLGRDDIGQLAPGMAADIIGVRVDGLAHAGAQHDPLAALVFCAPSRVDMSVIDGRLVVWQGELLTVDVAPLVERHNALSRSLVAGA